MYEFFIVGRRDERRRQIIHERHRAVSASIRSMLQHGVDQGDFPSSLPVEPFTHLLISFLDGVFIESMISGSDRIHICDQFELLKGLLKPVLLRKPEYITLDLE